MEGWQFLEENRIRLVYRHALYLSKTHCFYFKTNQLGISKVIEIDVGATIKNKECFLSIDVLKK